VPYRARSPARSAAEGHAQIQQLQFRKKARPPGNGGRASFFFLSHYACSKPQQCAGSCVVAAIGYPATDPAKMSHSPRDMMSLWLP
jgi:hypothetical protein